MRLTLVGEGEGRKENGWEVRAAVGRRGEEGHISREDALRRLHCLGLAPQAWVVPGCAFWGSQLAARGSPTAPVLGLRPRESQASGQSTKARHCWQGSAGVSVDTFRHF